jgi:hypothetical protein
MISAMMVAMQARTKKTQPKPKPNRLWVFLPMAVAFGIIAGIAIYGVVNQPKANPHPDAPGFHGSLVWGDGIFSNRAQLKAWLILHGASYEDWVKQHPAALKLVKPPAKHRVAVAHKPSKSPHQANPGSAHKPVHKPVTVTTAVAAPPETSTSSSHRSVIWLAVIAGLLLGLVALMPRRILHRAGFMRGVGDRELRLGALGAGAAVLLGVIVANLL